MGQAYFRYDVQYISNTYLHIIRVYMMMLYMTYVMWCMWRIMPTREAGSRVLVRATEWCKRRLTKHGPERSSCQLVGEPRAHALSRTQTHYKTAVMKLILQTHSLAPASLSTIYSASLLHPPPPHSLISKLLSFKRVRWWQTWTCD